jgi:UDP-N-acetylglucosamine 3-dehydrogenase
MKIRVGVIGVGKMGWHHTRVLSRMPEVKLVAVGDLNTQRGQKAASQFNCAYYPDYRQLLTKEGIQACIVAVPTTFHYQVAKDVLIAGAHLLLEKPMVSSLKEARLLIRLAEKNQRVLVVGYIERFNPVVQKLKEMIDNHYLGKIYSINFKRFGGLPPTEKQADVVLDLASHDIDLASHLLGVASGFVFGTKIKHHKRQLADSVVLCLRHRQSLSLIEANWITPIKIRTLELNSSNFFVQADLIKQDLKLFSNYLLAGSTSFKDYKNLAEKFGRRKIKKISLLNKEPLAGELESFIKIVINPKHLSPLASGEDGYQAIKLAGSIKCL